MPCGGIYPVSDGADRTCFQCNKVGGDHFVEEWDAFLHKRCVIPFLHTPEGELVLEHKHSIQIGRCELQPEGGELMDPNATLKHLRGSLAALDIEPTEENAELVLDAFENLDGWLKLGGFLPTDWKRDA